MPKKLVLAVVDAMKPAMLARAVASGQAPALALLMQRGQHVADCVAAFPSVTPVCSASIATGSGPDRHLIPSMNWYHRGDQRYVEYGTSFKASQAFGFKRSLTDTIYNMNLEHLSSEVRTVFEHLDDADVRTAGTTYLMYRGRHRHDVTNETALTRIASTVFRHAVYGPREFFYADLFASRRTGCRSQLGMPGVRDQHAGCVGQYLVEHDLFDFLLLSLPDNDTHSHKYGPDAQVTSLVAADRQLERLMHAAGGPDAFLDEYAVIVCSDHSQSRVDQEIDLFRAFDDFSVLPPSGSARSGATAEIALCPSSRAAQAYVLDRDARAALVPRVERTLLALEGVDLTMSSTGHPDGEIAVRSRHGELRFAPRGDVLDLRGESWSLEGDLGVLGLELRDGRISSVDYPDALGRVWSALRCRTSGDVLASAAPGYEFLDWGRSHHVGGGSHGSLHAQDSLGSLLWCATGPDDASAREQWTLRDILPMILDHFGLPD